jgi:hypothetical protein
MEMASRDATLCRQADGRQHQETQPAHRVQTGRSDDVGIVAISAQVALCGYPHRSMRSATSRSTRTPRTSCSCSSPPLRTRQPDRHQQQTLQRLGRDLRRPSITTSYPDTPTRPGRRRTRTGRRIRTASPNRISPSACRHRNANRSTAKSTQADANYCSETDGLPLSRTGSTPTTAFAARDPAAFGHNRPERDARDLRADGKASLGRLVALPLPFAKRRFHGTMRLSPLRWGPRRPLERQSDHREMRAFRYRRPSAMVRPGDTGGGADRPSPPHRSGSGEWAHEQRPNSPYQNAPGGADLLSGSSPAGTGCRVRDVVGGEPASRLLTGKVDRHCQPPKGLLGPAVVSGPAWAEDGPRSRPDHCCCI